MKKLLFILLMPVLCLAQQEKHRPIILTKDSLGYPLDRNWRFNIGDSPDMALPRYVDSGWKMTDTRLYQDLDTAYKFNGFKSVGWFRLHFSIDSTISGRPLALRMTQAGASEVYLDGELIKKCGRIAGEDSSIYFDPQWEPFIIIIPAAGEHVLAIRYANYKAQSNLKTYEEEAAGFSMMVGDPDRSISQYVGQMIAITFVFLLLFGIFIALAVLHLILFLYNRTVKSNLYFSVFAFSVAMAFMLPYLMRVSDSPQLQLKLGYCGIFTLCAACVSLSGFINEIFSRKKLRFWLIALLSILVVAIRFFDLKAALVSGVVLMVIVALETVVVIVSGIFRRVPGARIIGFGMLFFSLFFLTIVAWAIIVGNFEINDSTTTGKIIELILALAVLSIPVSMSSYLAWSFSRINKDLAGRLAQVEELSERNLEQEHEKKRILESQNENLEREVALRTAEVTRQKNMIEQQHEELKIAKGKSDDLLLNILPAEIAEELKETGNSEARQFDQVSVLFTDFVNFTIAGEKMTPQELVTELHTCFKAFDEIISKYGIEKIKTIGDAYLAVCGVPVKDERHAAKVVSAALEIVEFMKQRRSQLGEETFTIRIGIHSGSVVAGIVGLKKFAYDIWGDTVNTAARMEQHSEAGRINISQTTYDLIRDDFDCIFRGEIAAKNKGAMKMYFVKGPGSGAGS